MNNPNSSLRTVNFIIAVLALIFTSLRFLGFLLVSGVFGGSGSGLAGSSPTIINYLSILLLPIALYVFYLGASGRKPAFYMWIAVLLLLLSPQFL